MFGNLLAIYKNKGYFIDTMHFYRCSLKAVGETIGLSKKELPGSIRYIDELKPYLYRDTKIVSEAIYQLKDLMGELGFKPRKLLTAGQLAMTSFLTHSKRNNSLRYFTEKTAHTNKVIPTKYEEHIRQAFRGGRVEAFKKGSYINTYSVDVNSLYPYIMQKMNFPDLKTEKYTA